MNEKLQIFSKYLPYGVEYINEERVAVLNIIGHRLEQDAYVGDGRHGFEAEDWMGSSKLLLRPLSSLTEEEWLGVFKKEHPGQEFKIFKKNMRVEVHVKNMYGYRLCATFTDNFKVSSDTIFLNILGIVESLYALHVDIHNAIEKGFAVDKTLKS